MSAFVIVELSVHDQREFDEYKKLTPATIEAYGGEFVVRGGETLILEGNWKPDRIVMLKFPSRAVACTWWNSEEYSKPKTMRQKSARTNMIVVDGI